MRSPGARALTAQRGWLPGSAGLGDAEGALPLRASPPGANGPWTHSACLLNASRSASGGSPRFAGGGFAHRWLPRRDGLTLTELVVAVGISALVGLMISQFMTQSGRQYTQTIVKGEAQKDLLVLAGQLRSDLGHLREYQPAEPRTFRRELPNLFEVAPGRLTFATCRGEKVRYAFDSGRFNVVRTVEILDQEELSIKDQILKKVQERVDATFARVTGEMKSQVQQKVDEFKEALSLGDLSTAGKDPAAMITRCTDLFDKLTYYTGTDGADSGFVKDLKESLVERSKKMASDLGYAVESDAEEIMGTLLTRYFQLEEIAPPKLNRGFASTKTFPIRGRFTVLLDDGSEVAPGAGLQGQESRGRLRGFRFLLESSNPVSSLESMYKNAGLVIVPNGLLTVADKRADTWNANPPPRVKLKIMDLITTQELTGRYYGEAILPDANILYKTWVEIPEFWFLDIFNTEEEVDKLRKKMIDPEAAEPK